MTDGGRSNEDIAKRLQALMTALGRNQSAFAVLVEITQPAMSNYVKGLRRPQLDEAMKNRREDRRYLRLDLPGGPGRASVATARSASGPG